MSADLPSASSTTATTSVSPAAAAAPAASGEVMEPLSAASGIARPAIAARSPSSGLTSLSKFTSSERRAASSSERSSGYAGKSLARESTWVHWGPSKSVVASR